MSWIRWSKRELMKIVCQIEDFQVWILQKAKIFSVPLTVLKTVLNCRQKLTESFQFEKTSHLIHRKEQ
jgi:hypothetical protein